MEAQQLSLLPDTPTEAAAFEIYVEDASAAAERYCWLTLYDSQVGLGGWGGGVLKPAGEGWPWRLSIDCAANRAAEQERPWYIIVGC